MIDATAAPVCIIAPISSWAAAVSGFVEGEDGLTIFVKAIPYNFYALLTLVMMVGMVLLKAEFGPMRTHERNAINGDIYTTSASPYATAENDKVTNTANVSRTGSENYSSDSVDLYEGAITLTKTNDYEN